MITFIGKKNNQTSVSDADGEIPTLGSTDNAGNWVSLVSGIIRLPSGWDFSVSIYSIYPALCKYQQLISQKRLKLIKSQK